MKNLLATTFIFAGLVANAQLSYCELDWTYTMQNLSGVFTWTNTGTGCPPVADQAIPFPTGTAGPLVGYTNVQTPGGDGYPGDIAPLGDQPDVYVVCGKDLFNESIADFSIGNVGATEFGGLHVGWTTPAGSFGSDLNIYCTDSLLLKELWVVEGATVNIQGPVFITKECHNAGTINIEEGGSLTFLVDKALHQCATFENLGTVNGEIHYETLYLSRPVVHSTVFSSIIGSLPQSVQDTLDPYMASYDPQLLQDIYADGYLTNVEQYAPISLTGYYLKGLPLKGVVYSPWSGDVKFKDRFKGFNNNAGRVAYQGSIENLLKDMPNNGGIFAAYFVTENGNVVNQWVAEDPDVIIADTVVLPLIDIDLDDLAILTSPSAGVFQPYYNFAVYYDLEATQSDLELVDAAAPLSWIPYSPELNGFGTVGYPYYIASQTIFGDLRTYGNSQNPEGRNILADTVQFGSAYRPNPNPFGLTPGGTFYDPPEELAYDFPADFHSSYQPSTNPYNIQAEYKQVFRMDGSSEINNIQSTLSELIAYSQVAPHIVEYTGTPWVNGDGQVSASLPYSSGAGYYYNTAGDLFALSEFETCIENNDTLYCYNTIDATEMYALSVFGGLEVQPDGDVDLIIEGEGAGLNRYTSISNPFGGYLNLNAVVQQYFDDNPSVNNVTFAWYSPSEPGAYSIANNPADVTGVREAFFRKYHRYNDQIYNSEYDFWVDLLLEYATNNPGLQNDLLAAFVADWQDDQLFNSPIVQNYLQNSVVTPFSYIELGQYLMPGGMVYVGSSALGPTDMALTPDMAEYNFDFPQNNAPYTISGDFNLYGRTALDSASITTVLCVDYLNDTTFLPHLFFQHGFEADAEDGTSTPNEDVVASSTNWPFLAGDSSEFYAAQYVREGLPHNDNPLLGIIPEPQNGDWALIPVTFQENTQSLLPDPPFERLGFRIADSNGNYGIKYLQENDTLWFRQDAYEYPVSVEVLFTNLIGDVTGDGSVESDDIIDFLAHYGECETDVPAIDDIQDYDFNGNGCVDVMDYLMLHQNFQHHLYVDDQFEPVQFGEDPINPNIVTSNYTDLETEPDVSLSGLRLTMAPGERVELYDLTFDLIGTSGGGIDLPSNNLFIIITDRRVGYVDARLP